MFTMYFEVCRLYDRHPSKERDKHYAYLRRGALRVKAKRPLRPITAEALLRINKAKRQACQPHLWLPYSARLKKGRLVL